MPDVFLPKGTRDLLPAQMIPRLRVLDTLRGVFAKYGFDPLETPAMERIETLTGKYGEEGDRLIFKVLKRGEGAALGEVDQALRYDLTVPLARVVAMNPALPMPFKRSHIAPVWRADRPQKGRFREFWQCDIDVVGADGLLADADVLACFNEAYESLGFEQFVIKLNHRALLRALAVAIGAEDRETSLLVALDKLDKIGREGVSKELAGRGFGDDPIARLWDLLDGGAIPGAEAAEAELAQLLELTAALGVPAGRIRLDRTLARGLDYYTGPVFEVEVETPKIGSIGAGGRYDGLIGIFAGRRIPAVGASLGLDRVLTVLETLGRLGEASTATQVWITVFSEETRAASLAAAAAFRAAGVPVELHLDGVGRLGRQLKAASARGVPYALVIGPDEQAAGQVVLKDLVAGTQIQGSLAGAIAAVQARG